MLFIFTTGLVVFIGFGVQFYLQFREKQRLLNELVALKREKFDRDLQNVKKQIRDDINSQSIDDLLKSE